MPGWPFLFTFPAIEAVYSSQVIRQWPYPYLSLPQRNDIPFLAWSHIFPARNPANPPNESSSSSLTYPHPVPTRTKSSDCFAKKHRFVYWTRRPYKILLYRSYPFLSFFFPSLCPHSHLSFTGARNIGAQHFSPQELPVNPLETANNHTKQIHDLKYHKNPSSILDLVPRIGETIKTRYS